MTSTPTVYNEDYGEGGIIPGVRRIYVCQGIDEYGELIGLDDDVWTVDELNQLWA